MQNDWEQINTLFNRVLVLPEEQHDEFLNSAEFKSPKLRKEVKALLDAYKRAPNYFKGFAQSVLGEEHDLDAGNDDNDKPNSDPYQLIGQKISHFHIFDALPPGGMGIVYRADDERLEREVALKFLPQSSRNDPRARERFTHEAKAASALDHVNVGTIYGIDQTPNGDPFIVMAYYQGDTLEDRISEGRLPAYMAVDIALQTTQGLSVAHQKGIIHRDIKPANLMLLDDGVVKILDFGLARIGDTGLTRTGEVRGTISYMSPEHIKGEKVDARADIWSLGVVLYEMLAGERPFKGAGAETVMYEIFHTEPDLLALKNAPLSLKRIVDKCLQRDLDKRYQSIDEVKAALEDVKPEVDQIEQNRSAFLKWLDNVLIRRRKRRPVLMASLIAIPVIAVLIISGTIVFKPFGATALPDEKHIVVLSMGQGEEGSVEKTLEQGLSSNIVRTLQMLEQFDRKMWVVPANKVVEYGVKDISQANTVLGANLVITISVKQENDNTHLTLALMDPLNNEQLGRHQVQRTSDSLSVLQQDIIGIISKLLRFEEQPAVRQQLIAASTGNAKAFENYTKGIAYLQRGDSEKSVNQAIKYFTSAVEVDPDYVLPYAGLGEAYWFLYSDTKDLEWLKKAERASEQALQLNDRTISAYLTMGRINKEMGKYGTARASYQIALQHDPNNADIYQGLAATYEATKNLNEAEKNYIKAISLKPNYWFGYNVLGKFYLMHGRYKDAIPQFKKVTELTPENSWAYNNLGASYWYLKDYQQAINMFNRSIEIERDYSVYSNLATLYFYQKDYKKAASMYEKALEMQDTDYSVWSYLAEAYNLAGEDEKKIQAAIQRAISGAKKQLEINPKDSIALSKLASYLAEIDKGEALRIQGELEILEPDNVYVIYRIGATYEKLGLRENALKWIEKAIANGYQLSRVESYHELDELRNDKRFQQVVEKYAPGQ